MIVFLFHSSNHNTHSSSDIQAGDVSICPSPSVFLVAERTLFFPDRFPPSFTRMMPHVNWTGSQTNTEKNSNWSFGTTHMQMWGMPTQQVVGKKVLSPSAANSTKRKECDGENTEGRWRWILKFSPAPANGKVINSVATTSLGSSEAIDPLLLRSCRSCIVITNASWLASEVNPPSIFSPDIPRIKTGNCNDVIERGWVAIHCSRKSIAMGLNIENGKNRSAVVEKKIKKSSFNLCWNF